MEWTGPVTSASVPLFASTATIATEPLPMSPAPQDSTSSSTEWAWPSAITTTTVSPIFSSPASVRAVSSATPVKGLSWTPRVPAASSDIKASAHLPCGLITTATACSIFSEDIVLGGPANIIADEKIEQAVAVVIKPQGRCAEALMSEEAAGTRGVHESPFTGVAEETALTDAGDENIG